MPRCSCRARVARNTRAASSAPRTVRKRLNGVDVPVPASDLATVRRRQFFAELFGTSAAVAFLALAESCDPPSPPTTLAENSGRVHVDDSFARLALRWLAEDAQGLRLKLLAHPALSAMLRHERLAGDRSITKQALLDRILRSVRRARPTSRVLEAWAGRGDALIWYAGEAARYLPAGTAFTGTIYLAMGYDIGVAAPPDVVLNVAHEHFETAPSELGFYATHEAHHVGFLRFRPVPSMTNLSDPARLRTLVQFMTQLEGMAVHAAYPLRRDRGQLGADHDYSVYANPAEADRVTIRYKEIVTQLSQSDLLRDQQVGAILNAVSSGERLAYRFGALVSWTLERERGRRALIASIETPAVFERAAWSLLRRAPRRGARAVTKRLHPPGIENSRKPELTVLPNRTSWGQ